MGVTGLRETDNNNRKMQKECHCEFLNTTIEDTSTSGTTHNIQMPWSIDITCLRATVNRTGVMEKEWPCNGLDAPYKDTLSCGSAQRVQLHWSLSVT